MFIEACSWTVPNTIIPLWEISVRFFEEKRHETKVIKYETRALFYDFFVRVASYFFTIRGNWALEEHWPRPPLPMRAETRLGHRIRVLANSMCNFQSVSLALWFCSLKYQKKFPLVHNRVWQCMQIFSKHIQASYVYYPFIYNMFCSIIPWCSPSIYLPRTFTAFPSLCVGQRICAGGISET